MSGYWQRYIDARTSRRRFLRGVAASGAAGALVLAGCGGGSKSPASPTGAADCVAKDVDIVNAGCPPRYGGRLKTGAPANFGSFDPHTGVALASAYFPRLYNVLLNQSSQRPEFMYFDLAESFELPEPDRYIFKIRPGVRVGPNDVGVPERDLDAEDVRVNLERIATTPASLNYSFAHDRIDSVEPGDGIVTVHTPAPYSWFINRIGFWSNVIAPREFLQLSDETIATKAAGAGAYRLISYTEGGNGRLDRNPSYYRTDEANGGARLPYLDGIDLSVIMDRTTLRTAFLSGQIHTYLASTGDEARSLPDAVLASDPSFSFIAFTMNVEQDPFKDPRVRRAFSRAINRQAYVDIVYGGDAQPDGLVHWPLGSYALPPDELERYQPYDLDEAKRLVREVGGIRVKMMYPANTTVLEHDKHLSIFLAQMQDAGIEIEPDPQEFSTWVTNYLKRQYHCSLALNQIYETPEIPLDFHSINGPLGDKQGAIGLGDADIEAAILKTKTTLDLDERIEAVRDAQRLIYERDPMFLPLVSPYTYEVYRSSVRNITSGIGTSKYIVSSIWLDEG